jgi:NADH-quinone oxidoreductase subunit C
MGVESISNNSADLPGALLLLAESFPNDVRDACCAHGDAMATVSPGSLPRIAEFLKKDPRLLYDVLVDITAVDYPGREARFDVVYHFLSLPNSARLRLKAAVSGEKPALPSLTSLWGNANWLEREVWDMFGIEFEGHPDLRRILLYPEFQGHPLRKDYPVRKRQPLIGPEN